MSPNISSAVVWVPCIPNYITGELIPLYSIDNYPLSSLPKESRIHISRGGIKSKQWSQIEDQTLIELVNELGLKKWAIIAQKINELEENQNVRIGKNCRERWYNHLDPEINSN